MQAGTHGDFAAYEQLLRVANHVFVRSHNTSYFPMVAQHIVELLMCSDAEKMFMAKKVFTKKTRNGCLVRECVWVTC